MDFVMRPNLKKIYRRLGYTVFLPLLAATLAIFLADGSVNRVSAQTNLQELQFLIKDLESKLADATRKQERAYNVQMQLEEQEQRLAELEKTESYKIQAIQIRADIQNIRTRIEAINKEKTDLEENLRVARNMQAILTNAQTTDTQDSRPQRESVTQQARISETPRTPAHTENWHINNVRFGPYFSQDEQNGITHLFQNNQHMSREDLVRNAYQIYNSIGVILDLAVQTTAENTADLKISLRRRDATGTFMTWVPTQTLSQFENRDFRLTVK